MKTYAVLETKSADLASDFGLSWATALFGEEAIASLDVRKSGKNKGCPKGFVIWRKARNSGWSRDFQMVVYSGKLVDAWIGRDSQSPREYAVCGRWLGRIQPLAASAAAMCFFEEGRERHAREIERENKRNAEIYAELIG
jgi:hypothetical protein